MIIHQSSCASVMVGDCLESLRKLPDECVNTCITSPPYFGLRDYGHGGQIGLEETPDAFVARLVEVFREVRRVLRDDGSLWLNIGDSYASKGGQGAQTGNAGRQREHARSSRASMDGCKEKDLIGVPWMLAFALRADGAASPAHMCDVERMIAAIEASYESRNQWPDRIAAEVERLEREHIDANRGGWYLRQEIIWAKPNPMPESVRDRCTKAHEQIFLLTKSPRYHFDADAIKEQATGRAPGNKRHKYDDAYQTSTSEEHRTKAGLMAMGASETRNKRSVWTVAPRPYSGAHFAVFPPELIEPCVLAGCPVGGLVLDPFGGSGTTAGVALRHGRNAIMCELNPEYAALMPARVAAILK